MSKGFIWINISYGLAEKCITNLGFLFFSTINRNIDFFLLNLLKIRYNSAVKAHCFELWSRILIAKFYLFESKLVGCWVKELSRTDAGIASGERILIQGPNVDYSKLPNKNYDRVIILKPNNFDYGCKVTLLNNHVSAHLAESVTHEKIQFTLNTKIAQNEIKYPEGTGNAFSLMGLQRSIYFCLKCLKVREIDIKGFDLYSQSTYNREFYPTLISKAQEFDELSESFYLHGIVGNFIFMKQLKENFTIDSDVLDCSEEEYLLRVWNNLINCG